jgi:hypothetical protein
MFNGLITATTIGAVAEVNADAGKIVDSSADSTLVGLKINGNAIGSGVTSQVLPKLGTVTIRKFARDGNGMSSQRLIADMLTISITQKNDFGLPVGSKIIVGHAQAFFGREAGPSWVGGQAWTAFETGTLLEQQGFQAVSCDGTAGKTHEANLGPITRDDWLSLSSAKTTAFAGPQGAGTISRTSVTLNGGNVFRGRITFDTIATNAEDKFSGGLHVRTTNAQFLGLTIDGQNFGSVAPNTRVPFSSWATLIVNRQTVPGPSRRGKTLVDGLYLLITDADNPLGRAAGTEFFVAHSEANADR